MRPPILYSASSLELQQPGPGVHLSSLCIYVGVTAIYFTITSHDVTKSASTVTKKKVCSILHTYMRYELVYLSST